MRVKFYLENLTKAKLKPQDYILRLNFTLSFISIMNLTTRQVNILSKGETLEKITLEKKKLFVTS